MAYRPQPELAAQITRALDPRSLLENIAPIRPTLDASLLARLEEEIPAKWLREVQRVFAAGGEPLPAHTVAVASENEAETPLAQQRGQQPANAPHGAMA